MTAAWNRGISPSAETKDRIRRRMIEYYIEHPEKRKEVSERFKGHIPWNKGVKAWNNGKEWPEEVKENISNGMVLYWKQRKQQ